MEGAVRNSWRGRAASFDPPRLPKSTLPVGSPRGGAGACTPVNRSSQPAPPQRCA